ncbi:hypothetical protein V2J09_001912 [Rumex salicifolius]
MVVEATANPKMIDDDDDDTPLVFKRRDISRQHQLNPELKGRASAQSDKPSGKVQDARTSNDNASSAPKGKVVQASKPSSSKLPVVQSSSTLSSKISPLKSTPQTPSSSLSHDNKKIRTEKHVTVKDEKPSKDEAIKEKKPLTSDSEDDKPLSSRLSIRKSSANVGNKQQGSSSKSLDGNSSDLSDDDKPLAFKLQQNGFIKRENQTKNPSVVPGKRPSDASVSDQSSAKKLKPSSQTGSDKAKTTSMKSKIDDENDHIPIAQRMKKPALANKSEAFKKKVTKVNSSSFKKGKKNMKKINNQSKFTRSSKMPPGSGESQKWTTLVHSGVIFPPPYTPHGVKILYDGKPVDLTPEQEEVATMYAVMLDTDYIQKEKFNENFFNDWKKLLGRNHVIKDLKKCDFTPIQQWHLREKEKKKQMTTEEKKAIKEEKMKQEEKYMWAIVDGVKEKVGNFRVEPPGLFRGRGEHPKMGKLKKRILPSDITLNIGKGVPIPECPIAGESWKEIRNDNTVTWLAFWNDPINPKEFKYVFLAASSTLKGQSDKEKYEKARMLKDYIKGIRTAYTKDFTSKDMTKRQIAVATYLIDRLALRAGNEKDDDEADTVGCCTLKVENVSPLPPNILEFDFLGKDSIRYHKQFEAEPLVFKAVEQFRKGKKGSDDLFDMLDTSKLNAHLKELMPGLTAKVFRTYNASFTLDDMLSGGTEDGDLTHRVCRYQVANKEVAIICNHQRSVSKSHNAQMERLTEKINELKDSLSELETDLARAKKGKPPLKDSNGKQKRNLTPEA